MGQLCHGVRPQCGQFLGKLAVFSSCGDRNSWNVGNVDMGGAGAPERVGVNSNFFLFLLIILVVGEGEAGDDPGLRMRGLAGGGGGMPG